MPPYVDSAIQKAIDAQPDYLGWGPKPEMAACNPAHNGAYLTPEGNAQAAKDIAAFYVADP